MAVIQRPAKSNQMIIQLRVHRVSISAATMRNPTDGHLECDWLANQVVIDNQLAIRCSGWVGDNTTKVNQDLAKKPQKRCCTALPHSALAWSLVNAVVSSSPERSKWLGNAEKILPRHSTSMLPNKSYCFTGNRLMTASAKGAPFGVVMRLAVGHPFVDEERTALEQHVAVLYHK